MGPGRASLSGVVEGPTGVVAGATVEVERLVGDRMARVLLTSRTDGTWQLPNVLGGRYLVRSWLTPSLAQSSADTFFLADGQQRGVTLQMASFSSLVESGIAPDPPVVAAPAQVVVQVYAGQVQSDGTVATQPEAGMAVQLISDGSWVISSTNPTVTDFQGQASWLVTCTAPGSQSLAVQVGGAVAGSTAPTTTTSPGSSGSTGSSGSSGSTTSTTFTASGAGSSTSPATAQLVTLTTPGCELPTPTTTTTPAGTGTGSTGAGSTGTGATTTTTSPGGTTTTTTTTSLGSTTSPTSPTVGSTFPPAVGG